MVQVRRIALGTAVAFAGIGICTAVMMPFRPDLASATTALVLVVPVVAGVTLGGSTAGLLAAAAGFLTYDLAFIKPYGTLTVGAGQNWVALIVYLLVVLLVSRLVTYLQAARAEARSRERNARRLYRLAQRLIADQPLPELLEEVLETVAATFRPRWAAILLPDPESPNQLGVVATIGEALSDREVHTLSGDQSRPQSLAVSHPTTGGIMSVALYVQHRPVGILAVSDITLQADDRELLRAYANQAAQAIERSQLQDAALRSEALEASERWRKAMVGAVSHDLRTPLATIKAAVTAVRESNGHLAPEDRDELLGLIEGQSDDLARLVTNLLDYTRIESGSLQLHREPTSVEDIVVAAVNALGRAVRDAAIVTRVPDTLPPVDVDELLMVQVVTNLLENALRHSPPDEPVEIEARRSGMLVCLTVRDHGAGVPDAEREHIFEMWTTSDGGGRAGLGLGIARAFVEAHGQHITYLDAPAGGAAFTVTLPVEPGSRFTPAEGWAPRPSAVPF